MMICDLAYLFGPPCIRNTATT